MGKGTKFSPAAQGHKQSSFRERGRTASQPCLSPHPCSSLYQLFRTPADTPGSRSLQPQLCGSSSLTATAQDPRPQGAVVFSVGHLEAGWAVPDGKSLCCTQSWFKSPCSVLLSWDPWCINKMWGKLPSLCGQRNPLVSSEVPRPGLQLGFCGDNKSSTGHTTLCRLPLEHLQPPKAPLSSADLLPDVIKSRGGGNWAETRVVVHPHTHTLCLLAPV